VSDRTSARTEGMVVNRWALGYTTAREKVETRTLLSSDVG